MPKNKEEIRSDFATRLHDAYARAMHTPKGHGMYAWVVDRVGERGAPVGPETVRRWFNGTTMPRPEAMQALASVLGVDPGYLAHGAVGGNMRLSDPQAVSIVYEQAEANRNAVAVDYVIARLSMMGLNIQRLGSSQVEVYFSSTRRAIMNVRYGALDNDHYATIDAPGPIGYSEEAAFRPLFIIVGRGPEEPDVFFLHSLEARLLGEGEIKMLAPKGSMEMILAGKKVLVRSDKNLRHVIHVLT